MEAEHLLILLHNTNNMNSMTCSWQTIAGHGWQPPVTRLRSCVFALNGFHLSPLLYDLLLQSPCGEATQSDC